MVDGDVGDDADVVVQAVAGGVAGDGVLAVLVVPVVPGAVDNVDPGDGADDDVAHAVEAPLL